MDKVYDFLNRFLVKDDVVVVGVSYGPDSMVLLNILKSFVSTLNLKIVVAHVNHKVRVESDDEEVKLKDFCLKNNLIFECLEIDGYSNANFHEEARIKRYEFFERMIKIYKAKYLFTAHHGDDLIETILMRLTRGSVFRGYAGIDMVYKRDGYDIVRPLLFVTKNDLLTYAFSNNIPYAVDLSNNSDDYTRNRYRHNVLPFLKNEDKNVHLKYLKFSRIVRLNDDYILKVVSDIYDKIVVDGKIVVHEFLMLDEAIKYRLLDLYFEKNYDDDIVLINDKHVMDALDLINSNRVNAFLCFPLDRKLVREYDFVYFSVVDLVENYLFELNSDKSLPNGHYIKFGNSLTNDNNVCRLASNSIKMPLFVRNKMERDRIEVKNGTGHVKLKKIFIDEKIPASERKVWPVVVDSNNEVVWLPGLKKSKYDRLIDEDCDIILNYE